MSKAVLISIQPKWCNLIASGDKTIEVRKNRPKLEPPFKCYIYCTLGKTKDPHELLEIHGCDGKIRKANGMVIGEFVCEKIVMSTPGYKDHVAAYWELLDGSCLTADELMNYGQWKFLYGWHISDLVIYDKPKELNEFQKPSDPGEFWYRDISITRPPQSWCYVEELPGGADREL